SIRRAPKRRAKPSRLRFSWWKFSPMSHSEGLCRPTSGDYEERKSMKRTFAIILAALAAAALFGGLVYAVLVAAHVSEPAATTVYGLTPRRLWATTVAALALVGVVIGGLALARAASGF